MFDVILILKLINLYGSSADPAIVLREVSCFPTAAVIDMSRCVELRECELQLPHSVRRRPRRHRRSLSLSVKVAKYRPWMPAPVQGLNVALS